MTKPTEEEGFSDIGVCLGGMLVGEMIVNQDVTRTEKNALNQECAQLVSHCDQACQGNLKGQVTDNDRLHQSEKVINPTRDSPPQTTIKRGIVKNTQFLANIMFVRQFTLTLLNLPVPPTE